MKQIKILHILGSMNRGGAETFIMNVYRQVDLSMIQFDFLLTQPINDYDDEIAKMGGNIYTILPRNNGFIKYRESLNKFFRTHANEYDCVHQHASSLTSIEPLEFAKKYGVKTRILHSHNSNQNGILHKVIHYINKIRVQNIATHYYGCSDKAIQWMFNFTGVKKNAILINNGILTRRFAYNLESRLKVRESLCLENQLIFGHIGRFCEVKNHKFIIDFFNSYLKKHGNSHLLLVGVGELLVPMKQYVKSLDIENSVSFLGLRSDTAELLQAMDIFLFPSLYEGLPVALVEAQTSGVMTYGSTNISNDARICNNIKYITIDNDVDYWVEYIHEDYSQYIRYDHSKEISEAGFDIKTTTEYLLNNVYHK